MKAIKMISSLFVKYSTVLTFVGHCLDADNRVFTKSVRVKAGNTLQGMYW